MTLIYRRYMVGPCILPCIHITFVTACTSLLPSQASRCIEQWVDAEAGPVWTRRLLIHMAARLTEHSASMRLFLESLPCLGGGSSCTQYAAVERGRDFSAAQGNGCGEQDQQLQQDHGGAGFLPGSLELMAAALGQEHHWLADLISHFGPMLDGGPSKGVIGSGGSSEVRAASLASTMQSVLDLCTSCCRLTWMDTRDTAAVSCGGDRSNASHTAPPITKLPR